MARVSPPSSHAIPHRERAFLSRYLEAANTLDANSEQRAKVRALLPSIVAADRSANGAANWLSGKKLPPGVYYCPASMAFQPPIDHIEASGKMRVTFEWNGDKLQAIVPTFEKAERSTGERKISFAYGPNFPQVASVAYDDAARAPATADPDAFVKQSSLVLQNNPYIDPVAIQQFTGKNIAVGIAGNRFFEPFVWDKIHYFQLTYDEQGRVSQAREMASPQSAPGDFMLEFEWDGQQLDSITGYQGKSKVYERSMHVPGFPPGWGRDPGRKAKALALSTSTMVAAWSPPPATKIRVLTIAPVKFSFASEKHHAAKDTSFAATPLRRGVAGRRAAGTGKAHRFDHRQQFLFHQPAAERG